MEGKRLLSAPAGGLPERRIAVLATFTLDYLPPLLAAALRDQGFQARAYLGGFNAWVQEILDPASGLYRFQPDAVLIVADLQDLFAAWYRDPSLPESSQRELAAAQLSQFESLLATLRERAPRAVPYVVVPPLDRLPGETVAGPADPLRGQAVLEGFLRDLRALAAKAGACVDMDWLARREGAAAWRDERLWYMGRMRLNLAGCQALAESFAYQHALRHVPPIKVIVVDLDGTLWGGVAGEDGWKTLELGQDGAGLAFREFQEELLRLRATGLLLAICSRNDEATAWEVFDKHPGMALKKEHFSAWRVNWEDKVANLESMAAELNLGLDSFLFLDDDHVQQGSVAARLPVLAPPLPKDPAHRPAFLRGLTRLHRASVTREDADRGAQYAARAERERLKSATGSLADYLSSLGQKAEIRPVDGASLVRAAQLCQKTNQFNLTTRRHSEADLKAMLADGRHEAHTIALSDSFGDNGIVGLGILRLDGAEAEIDTLLMSCRVLGRKAEVALLSHLAARAKARGAKRLLGRYLPTEKNGHVKDFYALCGFEAASEPGVFRLDLERRAVEAPKEISIAIAEPHAGTR